MQNDGKAVTLHCRIA